MNIELDLKNFWEENDICIDLNNKKRSRIPIYYWLDDHFLLEGLNPDSTIRYYNDYIYKLELHNKINDRLESELGKRFFSENPVEEPVPNRFEVIMGSYWKLMEGGTPWLESSVESIEDVKRLNEKNIKLDMKKAAFPDDWNEKKDQYEKKSGNKIKLGGFTSRGPATMATSILGTTNTCLFMCTELDVMEDFFKILADKLVEYHKVLMHNTDNKLSNEYSIYDDNCYLFPPAQYEIYCAPVLRRLFSEFAPGTDDKRYQHSDSAMGHLMEILRDTGVNQVNLGPTIHPLDIRKAMPEAIIFGQMPPFSLRNGKAEEIIDLVKRDIDTVGRDGKLVECTAGSVAGGTPLDNIRLYMWAVQEYGKF